MYVATWTRCSKRAGWVSVYVATWTRCSKRAGWVSVYVAYLDKAECRVFVATWIGWPKASGGRRMQVIVT